MYPSGSHRCTPTITAAPRSATPPDASVTQRRLVFRSPWSSPHVWVAWDAAANQYRRRTTLAGGVEGGISTGELVVVRAAMKPLATLNIPVLETVDTVTKESTVSFTERTDVTAVPAMGVVAETMVALVLASEAQRKFGGDTVDEFVRNAEAFRAGL